MRWKAISRRKLLLLTGLAGLLAAALWLARPLWVRYQLDRAQAAYEQENLHSALDHLQAAERVAANDPQTQFWLARVNRRLGRFDEMNVHLEHAEKLGFSRRRVFRERLLAWAQNGEMNLAEPHLADLLTNAGEDGPEICRAFVNGYCLQLRFDTALTLLAAWEGDYPDDPAVHFLRGRVWHSQQNWDEAADAYEKGLKLAPERLSPRIRLAECLVKQQNPREAEGHYRRCLDIQPDQLEALVGLANCLIDRSQLEQARTLLLRALKRNPDHFDARRLLGQLELAAGQPGRAIDWVKPLVESWPDNSSVCYLMAQACESLGDGRQADKYFARVERAEQALNRIDHLTREVASRPEDVDLRYELGRLLLQYRSREEGVAWLNSVLLIDPDHRAAHAVLADYYAGCDRTELAARHRRKAGGPEAVDD